MASLDTCAEEHIFQTEHNITQAKNCTFKAAGEMQDCSQDCLTTYLQTEDFKIGLFNYSVYLFILSVFIQCLRTHLLVAYPMLIFGLVGLVL